MKDFGIQVFCKPFLHPAVSYVPKVFQPLEIRNGNPACVEVHIQYYKHAFFGEYFTSLRRQGTIGCFTNDFCLNPWAIFTVDNVFQSSRNKNIAFHFQCFGCMVEIVGSGHVQDRSCFFSVPHLSFKVVAGRTPDSTFVFCNTYQNGSCFLEKLGGMITYVSKTLYYHPFTFNTFFQSQLFHQFGIVADFADSKEYPQSGSLFSASYTTLVN